MKEDVENSIKLLREEVTKSLLNGKFEIYGVFSDGSFRTIYNILIDGCINIKALYEYGNIYIQETCFNICFTTEETKIISENIKKGGLSQCIKFKKQQIDDLTKEVSSLELLLK